MHAISLVSSLFRFFLDRGKKQETRDNKKLVGRKVGRIWEELGKGKTTIKIDTIKKPK